MNESRVHCGAENCISGACRFVGHGFHNAQYACDWLRDSLAVVEKT